MFDGFVNFSPTILQWLSILYLGIVPTGIGFWLWNKGTKKVNDTALAVMNNLKIPVGVVIAFFIFHENTNIIHFSIGAMLILAAIIGALSLKEKE